MLRDRSFLADDRAEGPRVLARGPGHQPVREVRHSPDLIPEVGPVGLQPEQLGHLHLKGDVATNVVQQLVIGRVDCGRFLFGPGEARLQNINLFWRSHDDDHGGEYALAYGPST